MINIVLAGIDIGASKTKVLLTDLSGAKLKTLRLLGKNFTETSSDNYVSFLEYILNQINSPEYTLKSVCFGIAGCAEKDDQLYLEAKLNKRFPQIKMICKSDIDIALNACISEKSTKLVIILGTGSIVLGKNKNGDIFRSGGWGYLFDDSNGASSLGKLALSYLAHLINGKAQDSQFIKQYINFFKSINLSQKIKQIYQADSIAQSLANCAQPLLELWNQNHEKSVFIVNKFIQVITENMLNVMKKLNTSDNVDLFLVGGLVEHQPKLVEKLKENLPSSIIISSQKVLPEYGAIKFIQDNIND
jgi:N-acetylglucosamine kinase-like BadF-type ATPase